MSSFVHCALSTLGEVSKCIYGIVELHTEKETVFIFFHIMW